MFWADDFDRASTADACFPNTDSTAPWACCKSDAASIACLPINPMAPATAAAGNAALASPERKPDAFLDTWSSPNAAWEASVMTLILNSASATACPPFHFGRLFVQEVWGGGNGFV